MDREKVLKVGSIDLVVPRIDSELLAIFRDDMTQVREVPARKYWSLWGDPPPGSNDYGPLVPVREYRVSGEILIERLELMGFIEGLALARLGGAFAADRALNSLGLVQSADTALAGTLTGNTWIERLRSSSDQIAGPSLDSRSWLLGLIREFGLLWRLRTILMAFPDAEVVLDYTEPSGTEDDSPPVWGADDAVNALSYKARAYAPTIVLTEGKTDAEFLGASLAILYPHLTDLIRFLDYDRRPEGGAAALANNVRAFAAAGITNRIIAIFDNDTGAAEVLGKLDTSGLPPGIKVIRYPDLELAQNYPTIGPPVSVSGQSPIFPADINGLAASIEVYLGRDVLTGEDGKLQPVQWTSYSAGLQRYQGTVTDKARIQEKFRVKYKAAQRNPDRVHRGDWSGLRQIIDSIRDAARDALLEWAREADEDES